MGSCFGDILVPCVFPLLLLFFVYFINKLRTLLLLKRQTGKFSFVKGLLNEAAVVLCRTRMK